MLAPEIVYLFLPSYSRMIYSRMPAAFILYASFLLVFLFVIAIVQIDRNAFGILDSALGMHYCPFGHQVGMSGGDLVRSSDNPGNLLYPSPQFFVDP